MTEQISVFGFGSFFCGDENAQDIDLLLIHQSTDIRSCRLAIDCKRHFLRMLPRADVVMLSIGEAKRNGFIARSGAIALGTLDSENIEATVQELVSQIRSKVHRR